VETIVQDTNSVEPAVETSLESPRSGDLNTDSRNAHPSPPTSGDSSGISKKNEESRRRWAAKSAMGRSCNPLDWPEDIIGAWLPAIDPKFRSPYTLGLPGADEPPSFVSPVRQSLMLPSFPTPTHAGLLFHEYLQNVAIFFNIIHPVSPYACPKVLISKPSIHQMLESLSHHGQHTLSLTEQALLLIIFALGAVSKNDFNAEMYYKNSQTVILKIFSQTSCESILCAFLTSLYQQATGRIEASWISFGIAVRMAQALGCISLASARC
jgi:hypothetical protein